MCEVLCIPSKYFHYEPLSCCFIHQFFYLTYPNFLWFLALKALNYTLLDSGAAVHWLKTYIHRFINSTKRHRNNKLISIKEKTSDAEALQGKFKGLLEFCAKWWSKHFNSMCKIKSASISMYIIIIIIIIISIIIIVI